MIALSGNLGDITAADGGETEALRDFGTGRSWTYSALDRAASALAGGLRSQGFQSGDRIGIAAANGAPLLIAYLGIMRAGMIAVPINHKFPDDTLAYIIADAAITCAIVDHGRESRLKPLTRCFTIGGHGPTTFETLLASEPIASVIPQGEEIAEILYTSGSTGPPKGVCLSHCGQVWALRELASLFGGGEHRTLVVAPLYHMNGLVFATLALATRTWLGLMPAFEPRAYLEVVAANHCTTLSGIPTMFAMIARERDLIDRLDLSTVTRVLIGSAPLTDALFERVREIFPKAILSNSYGTTEAGPMIFGAHPDGLARPPLALGHPAPGVEMRLADGNGDEGVLELRTPSMMVGYLNLPDASAEKLLDGWYRTGDILRRDREGFYYFVGRADDMFICGGENLYPGEVEKLIERHPTVLQAAVLPIVDEIKGHIPIAFVVPAPGEPIDPVVLRDFCLANAPAYMHPRFIEVVDALPVGGSHKVDRRALLPRAQEIGRTLAQRRARPAS